MTERLKVGVVGAGVIAQVMHLNYLRELSDRFEAVALCDISDENANNNADRYDIGRGTPIGGRCSTTPTSMPSSS